MKRTIIVGFALALFLIVSANWVAAQIPRLPVPRPTPTPQKPAVQTASAPSTVTQGGFPKHFFFTTEAKGMEKVLRAKDLTACIFGDNANPSNKNAFKKVVPTVGGQKGRVIDAGTCDVVVLVIKDAEAEKNLKRDNAGFVVYKIVGDDLELLFAPETGQYIAVGKPDLASKNSLKKSETRACGSWELRNSFRPNPNTWANWRNEDTSLANMTPRDVEILWLGCDVWIMTIPKYNEFSAKFKTKYPLFDTSPSNPELTKKK